MEISPTQLYSELLNHFGHQDWWPVDKKYHKEQGSDPRFEIIIGAILTQNTAWTNVEKALKNLKQKNTLTIQTVLQLSEKDLKTMIQPSGFFNQKTRYLKSITTYLHGHYHGDIEFFFSRNIQEIRQELLSLQGIGPETADSILLYAGNLPIFVVDAYTKRLCKRIPMETTEETYETIQHFFETNLQQTYSDTQLTDVYQELHALLVELAKNYCRKKPFCDDCPITKLCKKSF
jgi:endonuclease-3 related protein